MLGPSGSGKTTVLRLIAGFEQPTAGRILLGDDDVTDRPPFERDVNTVFQDYAIFPHMSVQQNVEYGLRVKKVPREQRRARAAEALATVRLAGVRRPAAPPAVRRPAAAGRAGAGPGQPAQGAPARRAARRARPQAAARDAGRAQADPARGRHHLRLRHARPGGGADDERPDRGVQRGADRAARRPRSSSTSSRPAPSSPASSAPPTCWRATAARTLVGRDGTFVIRPEKIRLVAPGAVPESGDGICAAPGVVREVVYLGAATRHGRRARRGRDDHRLHQNSDRSIDAALERREQRVVVTWQRDHLVSLGGSSPDPVASLEEEKR